jgi:ferredoxin
MRCPVVELSDCILCEVCVEVCPEVFSICDAGYIAIADIEDYPEECVDEAMRNCPKDCISWEG